MNQGSAVGILYKDGKVLVERRQAHEKFYPGAVMFPGGSIEDDETPEQGLLREMHEELGITIKAYRPVGIFYHADGHKINTFLVTDWEGSPTALEAAEVFWISDPAEITDEKNQEMYQAAIEKADML